MSLDLNKGHIDNEFVDVSQYNWYDYVMTPTPVYEENDAMPHELHPPPQKKIFSRSHRHQMSPNYYTQIVIYLVLTTI